MLPIELAKTIFMTVNLTEFWSLMGSAVGTHLNKWFSTSKKNQLLANNSEVKGRPLWPPSLFFLLIIDKAGFVWAQYM